jgi:murein L,D-transpeptidase YcbB/YkuD
VGDAGLASLGDDSRGPRSRLSLARDLALALAIATAGPALVQAPHLIRAADRAVQAVADPQAAAVRHAVRALAPDLDAAYAARGYRPLWITDGRLNDEAASLLRRLDAAGDDGLAASRYDTPALRAALSRAGLSRSAAARAEVALTSAAGDYLVDLHRPLPAARLDYRDPALPFAPATRRQAIEALARAPALGPALAQAARMNPLYARLKRELQAHRAAHPDAGYPDPAEQTLLANMERLRALPPDLGPRYVLVDAAGAHLWMVEHGAPRASMRVVVGKTGSPTPLMAGLIRYAVLNPYWNVPPDLLRARFAPRAAANPGWVSAQGWEVLTDASDQAQPLNAALVDWSAVEAGTQSVWLRQRPGPGNMMGAVKFMFPNPLGVYLHDTPHRADFLDAGRTRSSGCVRLEHARWLERWLFAGAVPKANGQPEQKAPLARPVPVYVAYLTAAPFGAGRARLTRDVYGRDAALVAEMKASGRL